MPLKDPEARRAYQRQWERRHYAKNAEAIKEKKRQWRQKNPEKVAHYERKCNLWREYGLTIPQYDQKLQEQGGVCAICKGTNPDGSRLAVDHIHGTDVVRALLCINCNKGLGHFKDNAERLEIAARYIRLYEGRKGDI